MLIYEDKLPISAEVSEFSGLDVYKRQGCILIFTGIQLLLIFFNITIPTLLSLIVIVVILCLSILLSFVF